MAGIKQLIMAKFIYFCYVSVVRRTFILAILFWTEVEVVNLLFSKSGNVFNYTRDPKVPGSSLAASYVQNVSSLQQLPG